MLALPAGATVTYARLYWSAQQDRGTGAGDPVVFERPGGFNQTVTPESRTVYASDAFATPTDYYQSSADVTDLVRRTGGGPYRVTGIPTYSLLDRFHNITWVAWALVVFYESPGEMQRNLALFDGLDMVENNASRSVILRGFRVPAGRLDAKLGVVAYEGEADVDGDQILFAGPPLTDGLNPASNFLNNTRGHLGRPVSTAGDLPQVSGRAGSLRRAPSPLSLPLHRPLCYLWHPLATTMQPTSQPLGPVTRPMRIGIIGSGGAGMTAAWLLDGRHDVTLFERSAVLGGHAHTTRVEIDGRTYYADDGFAWFSDAMYPNYMRLLELCGIPTRIVPMTLSFTQARTGARALIVPPHGLGGLLLAVTRLPTLRILLQLKRAIGLGAGIVARNERFVSWAEFVERYRFPEPFCQDVLTPLVTGAWGGPYDRTQDFSTYTLMKYLVFHSSSGIRPYKWHAVRDGAASYIARIGRQLERARILAGVGVEALERRADGWLVRDSRAGQHAFDHVLLAVGVRDAQRLLRDAPGIDETRKVVDRFEHYTARLATHSDPRFMPERRKDWQVANIRADGPRAHLTTWTGSEGGAHVFTSYVSDREPERCHHVSTFHLPLITPEHHRAQDALLARQGQDGLWFAGDWTRDIGSHEDAVTSAIEAVRRLDPEAPRLARLSTPRALPRMQALPDAPPQPSAGA